MVYTNLTVVLNIETVGDDLEPIKSVAEIAFDELVYLINNRTLNCNPDTVLLDLDKELYFGKDIINMIDLNNQIEIAMGIMSTVSEALKPFAGVINIRNRG